MRLLITSFLLVVALVANATTPIDTSYWKRGTGLGLSLDQGLIFNPPVGAGQNRIGAGGLLSGFANFKRDRSAWDSDISWALSAQRLGAGVIAQGTTERLPFTKTNDLILLNSKYGYAFSEGSKWFAAVNTNFRTQLLPTYTGNYLRDLGANSVKISDLLSPAFLVVGVGIDYKPSPNFSVFYSPLSYKANIVMNEEIAALKIFTPEGERVFSQVGSNLVGKYAAKYYDDRLMVSHQLGLFSNYLKDPQNIDVDFQNIIGFQLYKGLSLQLVVNMFYDHDTKVQVTDFGQKDGVEQGPDGKAVLGRKTSVTETFLIKYGVNF